MTAPYNHPEIDDCLFHYTSAGGLKGIFESGCIWATDAAFLNDSSEVIYAGREVELHLQNLVKHLELHNPQPDSPERVRLALMASAADALQKFNDAEGYAGSAPYVIDGATYVSCFTERPDQLSQWRGYGGRGYSVGLKKDALNNLEIDGEDQIHRSVGQIQRVLYGEEGLESLRRDVAQLFDHRAVSHPGSAGFTDAVNVILPRLARVKHRAFEEEKEWRLIVSRYGFGPAKKLYLRESGRLVPYLKLKFDPSAVAFIYIGPGGTFNDERALRALLRGNGYEVDPTRPGSVWIEHSDAPFRDA
jgi:hypothetical protein